MENNNRQGCRWVKASERLPPVGENVVIRDKDGSTYTDRTNVSWDKRVTDYEWLDESIEPCATSSENYWKQRCEVIEELVDKFGHLEVYGKATENYNKLFNKWQELKSTPSPTGDRDCEELKIDYKQRELERGKPINDKDEIVILTRIIEEKDRRISELEADVLGLQNEIERFFYKSKKENK